MSETTKKPAPRRSRAKPKTAPKARSDAGTPLCAVFTAGPTTIRTGPGRGFEAAGEAAAGDWLLALPDTRLPRNLQNGGNGGQGRARTHLRQRRGAR